MIMLQMDETVHLLTIALLKYKIPKGVTYEDGPIFLINGKVLVTSRVWMDRIKVVSRTYLIIINDIDKAQKVHYQKLLAESTRMA